MIMPIMAQNEPMTLPRFVTGYISLKKKLTSIKYNQWSNEPEKIFSEKRFLFEKKSFLIEKLLEKYIFEIIFGLYELTPYPTVVVVIIAYL